MIRRTIAAGVLTALAVGMVILLISGSSAEEQKATSVRTKKPKGASSPTSELRKKLALPVTLEKGIADKTALGDALKQLSEKYHVPFLIDRPAFEALGVMMPEEQPVQLPRIESVPLSRVLNRLASQIRGDIYHGTYRIRGDHVEITSTHTLWEQRLEGLNERIMLPPVQAQFEKRALDEALEELCDWNGFNVVMDAGRAGDKAKATVTATFDNVPLDTAVRLLADMAGLKAVRLDNVFYVTTPANADAIQEEQDKRVRTRIEFRKANESAGPGWLGVTGIPPGPAGLGNFPNQPWTPPTIRPTPNKTDKKPGSQ
jgi:hypothetical protein